MILEVKEHEVVCDGSRCGAKVRVKTLGLQSLVLPEGWARFATPSHRRYVAAKTISEYCPDCAHDAEGERLA